MKSAGTYSRCRRYPTVPGIRCEKGHHAHIEASGHRRPRTLGAGNRQAQRRLAPSFRESFQDRRKRKEVVDLMHVDRARAGRPHEELFQRHAAAYDQDPFKGTVERRVAPPDMPSVEGDAMAARAALADAGIGPKDVSLILSSAVVPDRVCPPNAVSIQHLCGCSNASALGVEAYCGSAPAQLQLAAAMIEAERARFVLCVQSQHITRAMDFSHPSSPVFGDASSAFVVGEVPQDRGLVGVVGKTDGALAGAVTWNYQSDMTASWRCKASAGRPLFLGAEDQNALRRLVDNALHYPIESIRELCLSRECPSTASPPLATICANPSRFGTRIIGHRRWVGPVQRQGALDACALCAHREQRNRRQSDGGASPRVAV